MAHVCKNIGGALALPRIVALLTSLLLAFAPGAGWAQSANLLPNAVQQFFNANGLPVSNGTVYFYIPSTSTGKTVWSDSAQTNPLPQPVQLNAGGYPQTSGGNETGIFGSGSYRQIVKDSLGNTVWDFVTSSPLTSSAGQVGTGDGLAVGTVMPYGGTTPPTNYLFTFGQAVSRTTYSTLMSALTLTQTITCVSSNTQVTVQNSSSMRVGAPIEASCLNAGTTISSITNLTTIVVSAGAASSGTVSATVFPWGNGNGGTTFNLPDFRSYVLAGVPNMGGTDPGRITQAFCGTAPTQDLGLGGNCGAQSTTLAQSALPNVSPTFTGNAVTPTTASTSLSMNSYTPTGTVSVASGSISTTTPAKQASAVGSSQAAVMSSTTPDATLTDTVSDTRTWGFAGTPATLTGSVSVTMNALTPSGTISSLSGGVSQTAFSRLPPTTFVNYIIKALPDIATTLPSIGPDSVMANFSPTAGQPTGFTMPNCSGADQALNYSYVSHSIGCQNIAGGGSGHNYIDVFLIIGDSNAVGQGDSTQSPGVPPGQVLQYCSTGVISDANDPTCNAVDPAQNASTGSMWPAMGLAYGRRVGLVLAGKSGSTQSSVGDLGFGNWDVGGSLVASSLTAVNAAMAAFTTAGYTPQFKGVVYVLGANDAYQINLSVETAGEYSAALAAMVARYRAATIGSVLQTNMPFFLPLVGLAAPGSAQPNYADSGYNQVRAAQQAFVTSDTRSFIPFANLYSFSARGLNSTNSHFTQAGYNQLGFYIGSNLVPSAYSLTPFSLTSSADTTGPRQQTAYTVAQDVSAGQTIREIVGVNGAGVLSERRQNGTIAAPTAVQSGDVIGVYTSNTYGATGWHVRDQGAITFQATENHTDAAAGTDASIYVTPNGANTPQVYFHLLNGPTTFYANATTGNDANPCSLASPCQTAQRLIDLQNYVDNAGFAVTLQLADGTYPGAVACSHGFLGGGTVTLQGNVGTPTNVVLNSGLAPIGITATSGCRLYVTGIQVKGTDRAIQLNDSGTTVFVCADDFPGGTGPALITAVGLIKVTCGITVSGNYAALFQVQQNGAIVMNQPVSFSGDVTFATAFINIFLNASINMTGSTFNLNGHTITGPRFRADSTGTIISGGLCGSLPGSIAGSATNQGQCL